MIIAAFGVPDLDVAPTFSFGDAELLQFDFFFVSATAALGFYTAAFVCEALRSGINSIPLGQAEAARSIGMTFGQTLRIIILPQAFRAVIPPIASALIAMTKNSSIAFGVGVAEATFRMKTLTNNYAGDLYVIFIGFALFYMAIVGLIAGTALSSSAGCGWRDERLRSLRRARATDPGAAPHLLGRVPAVRRGCAVLDLPQVRRGGAVRAGDLGAAAPATASCRELRKALVGTLKAAALVDRLALVVGFFLAVGRLSDHAWVRVPCVAIVEFFRAVPLLLLMIFLFVVHPAAGRLRAADQRAVRTGRRADALQRRGARRGVPRRHQRRAAKGQSEAAYAIGMRKTQVMTMILTPQAVKFMLPAIISQCVVVLKDTSLGFAVATTPELVSQRQADRPVRRQLPDDLPADRGDLHRDQLAPVALAYWLERRLATRGRGEAQAVAEVEGVLDAG